MLRFSTNMLSIRCFKKFYLALALCILAVSCLLYYRHSRFDVTYPHENRTSPIHNHHSHSQWRSLQLDPKDKTGKATHRRYGDPLQLYSLPVVWSDVSNKKYKWVFDESHDQMVDCRSLFLGHGAEPTESLQADITCSLKAKFRSALQYANTSCEQLFRHMGYITSSLTSMEASFPIAYSILVYKDVEQFEILLRAIYRPQNVYCVHVDKKSSNSFRADVETLAGCFDNVFITSHSTDVQWGSYSVLEPDISCLKELWENKIKWKYFINLTGQELPIRTNFELVKILTSFDGANNVEGGPFPKDRIRNAGPAPHGVDPVKGAVHVVLSRSFVDYLLHNQTAIDLLEWSKKLAHPDEVFFSTLNYNKRLEAPGAFKGAPKTTNDTNPFLVRLKNWSYESNCHGKHVRAICIFGTKDLPLLATREELFANKMHFYYHPEVLMCMQELLYNRTADEYHGLLEFDVSYYASREFVKNRF